MKKRSLLAVLVLILILAVSGCAKTAKDVLTEVDNKNYEKAVGIIERSIKGDAEKEREVADGLLARIEKAISEYNSGKMDLEDVNSLIDEIDKIGICDKKKISTARDHVESITVSQRFYQDAEEYMRSEQYVSAYKSYCLVHEDDAFYNDAIKKSEQAQSLYFQQIIDEAQGLYDQGQFEEAIAVLDGTNRNLEQGKVWEQFQPDFTTLRSGCFSMLRTAACDEALSLGEEGSFTEAFTVLQNWTDRYSSYDEMMAIQPTLEALIKKYDAAVIQEAVALEDAGEYLEAIEVYEKTAYYPTSRGSVEKAMPTEVSKARTACMEKYIETVKLSAQEAFGEKKDYEAAIRCIQGALGKIGYNDELYTLIEHYQEYTPIMLTSLKYTQKGRYIGLGDPLRGGTSYDVNENQYDTATEIYPTGGSLASEFAHSDDDAYVLYNLNFKYSTLSGIVYRPYSSLSSTEEWKNGTSVKIYGDDVLLYEAPNITKDTYDAYEFSLDVSGVRNLKIIVRGMWTSSDTGWIGMYNYHPKVCLAELYLQR